jgi:hypothetical protein
MTDLKTATHKLEDSIITLSGPALAISGILAGVDLLTGGTMMTHTTWLQFAWAITLLISLDFQVLALGARAHRIYQRRGWWELLLAIAIAAAISYVSIQMQSIIARANSAGLDIATATAQLGINPIWLIWERSALVLILIFLSGWFREEQVKQPETPSSLSDETVQLILSKLAKLDELEHTLARGSVTIDQVSETPLALVETAGETGETEGDETSLHAQIRTLLGVKDDLSSREIATIVGRPHSTVYRHLAKVKQSPKE